MNNFYDKQTTDFKITQGDTANLPFDFYDNDGNAIDITGFEIKFNVRNIITGNNETLLYKYHGKGGADDNDGLYYTIDTNTPASLIPFLTSNNQIIIVLAYTDTLLDEGIYPYDVEIYKDDNVTKFTAIKGNLIITKEITPSV